MSTVFTFPLVWRTDTALLLGVALVTLLVIHHATKSVEADAQLGSFPFGQMDPVQQGVVRASYRGIYEQVQTRMRAFFKEVDSVGDRDAIQRKIDGRVRQMILFTAHPLDARAAHAAEERLYAYFMWLVGKSTDTIPVDVFSRSTGSSSTQADKATPKQRNQLAKALQQQML
jgi:hypothetical protein